MSGRAQILIRDGADRALAKRWVDQAPIGTRVEYKGPQRSLDQNSRLWAMLSDVARQGRVNGRKFSTNDWKLMFMHAYAEERGVEIKYLPALNRAGMVPCGRSSSDLSVGEMAELQDWIEAWGAENGIVWSEPKAQQQQEYAA